MDSWFFTIGQALAFTPVVANASGGTFKITYDGKDLIHLAPHTIARVGIARTDAHTVTEGMLYSAIFLRLRQDHAREDAADGVG